MIRLFRSALAALTLTLAWAVPAQAEEKILSYDSHVAIQQDGALDVTETITVRAEGERGDAGGTAGLIELADAEAVADVVQFVFGCGGRRCLAQPGRHQ